MDEQKIKKSREKKEKIVVEIAEKVGKAKALVFANYQGMTHKQLEDLKKALKNVQAELVVTKNTLLGRALQERGITGIKSTTGTTGEEKDSTRDTRDTRGTLDTFLEGPTATLFSYGDPIAALKELAKTIRTIKLPAIKFGIFEGKLLAEEELVRLSTLPSREVLLAQLVGGMKAPLFGLHRALSWNLQKLVITLKTIENSKK